MENDNDILDLYVPLTFTTGYVFCTQLHRLGNNKAFCNKLYATQSVGRCWNNLWKTKSFYLLESDRLFLELARDSFQLAFHTCANYVSMKISFIPWKLVWNGAGLYLQIYSYLYRIHLIILFNQLDIGRSINFSWPWIIFNIASNHSLGDELGATWNLECFYVYPKATNLFA